MSDQVKLSLGINYK